MSLHGVCFIQKKSGNEEKRKRSVLTNMAIPTSVVNSQAIAHSLSARRPSGEARSATISPEYEALTSCRSQEISKVPKYHSRAVSASHAADQTVSKIPCQL